MSVTRVICGLLLLAGAQLAASDSAFTLNWQQIPIEAEKGIDFYLLGNPKVTKDIVDMSLAMVNLPPCAARAMHIHMNTDEIHYALAGNMTVGCALPNGTLIWDNIVAGQAFVAPRNHVHSLLNPSCTENAAFIGIYNTFSANNNNVALGALNMVGSPFEAYTDPAFMASLRNAAATFDYDARCLTRCKLGAKGGQMPARSAC